MLRDDLNIFTKAGDPGALTANTVKWIGDTIDLWGNTYARNGGDGQDINLAVAQDYRVLFLVTTEFSETNNKNVRFVVGTSDSGTFAKDVTELARSGAYTTTSASNQLPKGTIATIGLAGTGGEEWRRYLGVGVVASTAESDEAGRFQAWLSTSDLDPELRYIKSRGWVA